MYFIAQIGCQSAEIVVNNSEKLGTIGVFIICSQLTTTPKSFQCVRAVNS